MIVAGIDPSLTNTGIAILGNGEPELVTTHGIGGHDADTYRIRSRRIRAICKRVISEICRAYPPDFAVIEGPAYGARFGNAFDRAGLWHGLYAALDARNIPIAIVAPKTLKTWATGAGTASKADIIATVNDWYELPVTLGRDEPNDNEADALVLAAMGAHHCGDPMPFTVKDRHTTGLEAVQWP